MKSLVFSFKTPASGKTVRRRINLSDIRYFFRRYGVRASFAAVLLLGLAAGAVYAGKADSGLLDSLDFLFTTNFEARLNQSAAGIFCACFASDFVFLAAVFLFGLAPWGIPALPPVILFKGFGTGLTAGWLVCTYALKGAAFYLVVLLPGTFLFCLALITLSAFSFDFSKKMFSAAAGKSAGAPQSKQTGIFFGHSMTALIMTFFAAVIDAALWTLLSGAFNF